MCGEWARGWGRGCSSAIANICNVLQLRDAGIAENVALQHSAHSDLRCRHLQQQLPKDTEHENLANASCWQYHMSRFSDMMADIGAAHDCLLLGDRLMAHEPGWVMLVHKILWQVEIT